MKPQNPDEEQIAGLVRSLNLAWREKQFDRLEPFFAETVVFQDSTGHRLVDGKIACIRHRKRQMTNSTPTLRRRQPAIPICHL